MKITTLNKITDILLDLEAMCVFNKIKELNFKIFSTSIEIYEKLEILTLLQENFNGTIENHEEYGYDAGQKFVIKLKG